MTFEKTPPTLFSIQRFMAEWLGWIAFPISIVAIVFLISGRSASEKAAMLLVLPTGLMCWIPLVYGCKALLRRQVQFAVFPLLLGLGCSLVSNPLLTTNMMKTLEDRYTPIDLNSVERFDAIVVLGGGTHSNQYKLPQLSAAGDRLSFACRMYHLKLVGTILVTGDPLRGAPYEEHLDPSVQAKQILLETGVAESDIEEIAGTTTFEEMLSLSKRKEWLKGKRCGLVTSAFHMRRALKLAEKNGLELVPIVTDFRAYSGPVSILNFLPAKEALSAFELATREYLGVLIGR